MNSLEELFFLYPKYDGWDIENDCNLNDLSENPMLTWKMVQTNLEMPWIWENISKHPNITLQIVVNNPSMPWDWIELLQNPNITWESMYQNRKLFWDSTELEQIEKDLKLTGDLYDNFSTINTHLEITKQKQGFQYQRLLTFLRWEMTILSYVSIPCWEIIQKNQDMGWDFKKLSQNPNITWNIIKSFPTHVWNWLDLSCNPAITWEIIQQHPNHPWKLHKIAENPNIPSHILAIIVEKNIIPENVFYSLDELYSMEIDVRIQNCKFNSNPLNLDWKEISKHPNLTMQIVKNNPTRPWKEKEISQNPNIAWETIPNLFGKYGNNDISANPTITWDIVEDNPTLPWNYYVMSSNPNMYHEEVIENLWKGWNFEQICSHHNVWKELCELGVNKWLTFGESKNLA